MKIKLMLAIALSHEANLLILDEPTSGLDPSMRDELTDILKEFVENENNTILFSTHITQDLDRIADYIIFIDEGRLVTELSRDDFYEKYTLVKGGHEELYLLDNFKVVGLKKLCNSFEALVESENVDPRSEKLIFEQPNIEKIMVLYGRNQNERD